MKLLVIFVMAFCANALAIQNVQVTSENVEETLEEILKDFKVDLPLDIIEKLRVYTTRGMRTDSAGLTAIVDEFVDKVFDNLKTLLANSSSNSISLPNISLKISNGKVNLSNGILQDVASLTRDGDVVVEYNNGDANIITLTLPIRFDDIKYSFDYQAKVLLISADGGLHGEIKEVKINVVLSFNFNTHQVTLDHYDMKHTGTITIKFTGNKLVDWLVDAISAVITATLHPLIVDILQKNINNVLTGVVAAINEAINGILNITTAASFI